MQVFIILALAAAASAQFLALNGNDPAHHIGSHQVQTTRGLGGSSSITNYAKSVDGPYSSIRKYDTRVTNDGLTYASPAVYAHHAPAHVQYTHSPAIAQYHAAPVAAYAPTLAKVATPIVAHHSPVYSAGVPVAKAVSAYPYSFVNPNTFSYFYNSNGINYHF